MNEYEHARQSLKTALWKLQSSPFYYQKNLNEEYTEDGMSKERYLKILKRNVRDIAEDLLDDFR